MRSGVNIDCNYVIKVSELMEYANLPYARLKKPTSKKLTEPDGTVLPLITVVCPV